MAGKTVSRRLTEGEAELYRCRITDRRRLEEIVGQMEQVSAAAAELLLRQAPPPGPPRPALRRAAQVGGYMVSEKCGTSATSGDSDPRVRYGIPPMYARFVGPIALIAGLDCRRPSASTRTNRPVGVVSAGAARGRSAGHAHRRSTDSRPTFGFFVEDPRWLQTIGIAFSFS